MSLFKGLRRETGGFSGHVPQPPPGPGTGRTAIVSVKACDPAVLVNFNFTPSSSVFESATEVTALSCAGAPFVTRRRPTEERRRLVVGWRTLLDRAEQIVNQVGPAVKNFVWFSKPEAPV
jgi:hypothetical protein